MQRVFPCLADGHLPVHHLALHLSAHETLLFPHSSIHYYVQQVSELVRCSSSTKRRFLKSKASFGSYYVPMQFPYSSSGEGWWGPTPRTVFYASLAYAQQHLFLADACQHLHLAQPSHRELQRSRIDLHKIDVSSKDHSLIPGVVLELAGWKLEDLSQTCSFCHALKW